MHPRRLWLFLAVFAALAAGYYLVAWQQERAAQAERAARRLFAVKEDEITEIAVKKAGGEIRLARREGSWALLQPLAERADQEAARQQAATLAGLDRDRDLGELQDPEAHGLRQPALVVEFTAQGQTRRLAVGHPTPGNLGYYVQRDQDQRLFTISQLAKESLDRPVEAFRDKTLFDFAPDKVDRVKFTVGPTVMELEKTGAGAWRWAGREHFKVRKDRLESLLRHLTLSRIKEFVAAPPKGGGNLGFAPVPTAEVAVWVSGQPPQTLILGARQQNDFYARKEAAGPLFLVEAELAQRVLAAPTDLEDRRLWVGDLADAARLVWGPPERSWSAVKEKDGWRLTGPDRQELRQPGVRLEAVLIKLQELEVQRLLPAPAAGKRDYLVEVLDGAGTPLVRLAQTGKADKDHVAVRLERGGRQEGAWLAKAAFEQWQADIARLTQASAADPKEAPKPEAPQK